MSKIFVYTDNSAALAELVVGAAKVGGEKPAVLVIGSQADVDAATALDADVFYLGEKGANMVEDYVDTIAALVAKENPAGLFIGATIRGRAIAGRLAAKLGITAFADAKSVEEVAGKVQTTHLVYGGGAVRTNTSRGAQFIAVLGGGVFDMSAGVPSGSGTVTAVDFVEPAWRAKVVATEAKPPKSANIAEAKKVVSVGLGLKAKEDMAMIEELAAALGAEVACSRPVAESMEWLPQERYVGISGAFVNSDLYVACGISGQVQHVVGVEGSKVVIAINKDKNAPFVKKYSDYAIVGDMYEVIPQLIAAIKNA